MVRIAHTQAIVVKTVVRHLGCVENKREANNLFHRNPREKIRLVEFFFWHRARSQAILEATRVLAKEGNSRSLDEPVEEVERYE